MSLAPVPPFRRLRGYSFDPSLSIQLDTALINSAVFKVRWEEKNNGKDDEGLKPGPVGEYLEVIDFDPASNCFYKQVDLNDAYILAQDGLPPSESNPLFHQQMVYAVAMTTIQNFEKALGRPVQWAPYFKRTETTTHAEQFVRRLRIYPHALREANAYYSPDKVALLFGYFPAEPQSVSDHLPGGIVFNCLSHDVIAHETTHAILDGLHRRYVESTHEDTLAFHEAFSDLVALFQHFTFSEVLEHQIAKTRGDLKTDNLLGQLAQQFGKAVGNHGALRDAIGRFNPETGMWQLRKPDPTAINDTLEPHARGAILVAAVFDAFIAIYRKRSRDLIRLASGGTGVLANGDIHPDLVKRLAMEASKTARHFLNICIRAIDYCPPVEMTFGDFLRAIITADIDLVPEDNMGYRIAVIEAFKQWAIYPENIKNLSVESLKYPEVDMTNLETPVGAIVGVLRDFQNLLNYKTRREEIFNLTVDMKRQLHDKLSTKFEHSEAFLKTTGLSLGNSFNNQIRIGSNGELAFEVHSLKRARRLGPEGLAIDQMIITITQTRNIRPKRNQENSENGNETAIKFRGGCTLIFDLDNMKLKYSIIKGIDDEERLQRQKDFVNRWSTLSFESRCYHYNGFSSEPFAFLHKL
jgi:hypothetical protein